MFRYKNVLAKHVKVMRLSKESIENVNISFEVIFNVFAIFLFVLICNKLSDCTANEIILYYMLWYCDDINIDWSAIRDSNNPKQNNVLVTIHFLNILI